MTPEQLRQQVVDIMVRWPERFAGFHLFNGFEKQGACRNGQHNWQFSLLRFVWCSILTCFVLQHFVPRQKFMFVAHP